MKDRKETGKNHSEQEEIDAISDADIVPHEDRFMEVVKRLATTPKSDYDKAEEVRKKRKKTE